jgi:BirA family biotin operon repressor/biotin-[acetyl-CoA-carboxylase] ligase
VSDGYDFPRLEGAIRAARPGRRLDFLEEVGSTQDRAFLLAEHGAPDGSVVLAERQTAGRGRLGRAWDAPPGAGAWFSILLRPHAVPPPEPTLLVAATALAAAEALEEATGLVPAIRWPNDLLVGDRKIAGILLETRDYAPEAPLFVLGVGINTRRAREEFPAEIRDLATSVSAETGRAPDRTDLVIAVLAALDRWRATLASGGSAVVEAAFRARAAWLGRRVSLEAGDGRLTGVLESASPVTGVLLRLDGGGWRAVRPEHAREVRLEGGTGEEE